MREIFISMEAAADQTARLLAAPYISAEAAADQTARMLAELRIKGHKGVSTIEAREALSIQHPAGRVMTLRRQGFIIDTVRITDHDHLGRPHTSALYVLKGVPRGR